MSRYLVPALLLIILCGCATPYRSQSGFRGWMFGGGYHDMQLSDRMFRITFAGNDSTSRDRVERHLLRRCAEVTLAHGARYFSLVDQIETVEQVPVVIPGNYSAITTDSLVSTITTGTVQPAQQIGLSQITLTAVIELLGDRPATMGPLTYDARLILDTGP